MVDQVKVCDSLSAMLRPKNWKVKQIVDNYEGTHKAVWRSVFPEGGG